jgi:hypothetical protein
MQNILLPTAGTLPGATAVADINAGFTSLQQNIGGVLTKSVAGGVDVTLTAGEANYGIILLTGTLTANINVNAPASSMQWLVYNGTGGAYTVTFKATGGTGVLVPQGSTMGLFCDGTNVSLANPSYVLLSGGNLTGIARPFYNNANTASGAGSFNFNPNTHGQIALVTLTTAGTVTLGAPTNIVEGAPYTLLFKAGDTSARTPAFNSAYKFPSATASLTAFSTTSGAYDRLDFIGGASNTLIAPGNDVR